MHWHVLLGKIMSSRNLHRKGWVSNTYCHILSKHRIKLSQLRPTKMMATTRRALDSIRALKVNRKLIQCYFELLNVAVLGSLSACLYLTSKFNIKSWTAESSLIFYVQYIRHFYHNFKRIISSVIIFFSCQSTDIPFIWKYMYLYITNMHNIYIYIYLAQNESKEKFNLPVLIK